MKQAICILMTLAMLAMTGCQHLLPQKIIVLPDGGTEQTVDMDATIALAQLAYTTAQQALTLAQQAYEIWRLFHPEATPEELAAEQSRHEASMARLQATLEQAAAVLQALYEARGAKQASASASASASPNLKARAADALVRADAALREAHAALRRT